MNELSRQADSKSPRSMKCIHRRAAASRRSSTSTGIASSHASAEFSKLINILRRAGVIRQKAAVFGRKTIRNSHLEIVERLHLPIEPFIGAGPKTIRPTDARPNIFHAELLQKLNTTIDATVLEMKPLAYP